MANASTTSPRLLLAYDGSAAAATAIRAAGRLFAGARARVVFVRSRPVALEHAAVARIAVPDDVLRGAANAYEREAAERASEMAERGRRIAEQAELEATAEVRTASSPWRALCAAGQDEAADVIVCGARGQDAVSRALLGSTSSSLLHHADRPVLVVPEGAARLDGPTVIGYDGSDGARAAIATAAPLIRGGSALVVHAYASPFVRSYSDAALAAVPMPDVDDLATDLREVVSEHARECAEEGATLAREAGLDARGIAVDSAGRGSWRALAATAESEDASLIVTGYRGRGALASTVLGSVSAGLIHNAERSVMIVRAPSV